MTLAPRSNPTPRYTDNLLTLICNHYQRWAQRVPGTVNLSEKNMKYFITTSSGAFLPLQPMPQVCVFYVLTETTPANLLPLLSSSALLKPSCGLKPLPQRVHRTPVTPRRRWSTQDMSPPLPVPLRSGQ